MVNDNFRDVVEEVRQASEISQVVSGYVQLKRAGSRLSGLCPFHREKTPSFYVFEDTQSFHCFGCGVGGNVITFVMMIENYEFWDAVKSLAERANITIERTGSAERAAARAQKQKELYGINKKAARFYYDSLNGAEGETARDYIKSRRLTKQVLVKCGIGYSPNGSQLFEHLKKEGYGDEILLESGLVVKAKSGNRYYDRFFGRLMFPIFDVSGNIVGFGGRGLTADATPKYLNSPETPVFEKGKLLYGLNFARKARKREIVVVEGYMDAVSLYQAGIMNVAASLGTAFTERHGRLLKNYADTVILMFDSDEAGVKAVYKALPHLVAAGLNVKVARLHDAKDPDDYIKTHGKEKLERLIGAAQSHIAFQIGNEMDKHDIEKGVDQKVAFTKEVSAILKGVSSEIERDAYVKETSRLTGISETAINAEMELHEEGFAPIRSPRPRKTDSGGEPKSVTDAQKRLLSLIASNETAFRKSVGCINETDFTKETFKELYKLIAEFRQKGKEIRAEEMTSCFDTADKQSQAHDILSSYAPVASADTEKDFNDQIKRIKLYGIEKKRKEFDEKNDVNGVQTALNEEKTVKRLYISLTDG